MKITVTNTLPRRVDVYAKCVIGARVHLSTVRGGASEEIETPFDMGDQMVSLPEKISTIHIVREEKLDDTSSGDVTRIVAKLGRPGVVEVRPLGTTFTFELAQTPDDAFEFITYMGRPSPAQKRNRCTV